jgi:hypothetical protein
MKKQCIMMYLAVFEMYYNVLRCIEITGPDTRQEPMYEAVLDVPIHAARVSIHAGCIQRHYMPYTCKMPCIPRF